MVGVPLLFPLILAFPEDFLQSNFRHISLITKIYRLLQLIICTFVYFFIVLSTLTVIFLLINILILQLNKILVSKSMVSYCI